MTFLLPTTTYSHRIDALQKLCVDHAIDGVIIGPGPQLAYLTGSWMSTHERFSALVVPQSGSVSLILPAVDRAELSKSAIGDLPITVVGWVDGDDPHQKAVALLPPNPATVAFSADLTADHILPLQQLLGTDCRTVLATEVLAQLFVIKDEQEIAQLRGAGQAIDRVHAAVPELLQAGRTEAEVATDLHDLIAREHTAVDFVIVGSMENGANPHHDHSDRRLETGDMVVVDIGGTYGAGYHSDCTRTYIVGGDAAGISPDMAAMYRVLYDAQAAAVAAVKPGMRASEIDAVARDAITAAGYGDYFIHRTGHGIGLSTHEEPFIMAGNDLVLAAGMAFSVEPGIYIPREFGARIEDIVVVTDTGCEVLNNQPRELL